MKLNGKVVRLFAVTLVLIPQLGIASEATVEGAGSNKSQNAPQAAAQDLSALTSSGPSIIKAEKDILYTLPSGMQTKIHEEVFQAIAKDSEEKNEIEVFVNKALSSTVGAGGNAAVINLDGGEANDQPEVGLELGKGLEHSDRFSEERIPLPYDVRKSFQEWKDRYKERIDDFRPFKNILLFDKADQKAYQIGKDNRINLVVTVTRFTGVAIVPTVFAMHTTHIPFLAALPFAGSMALVSGGTQFLNLIMPWNDIKTSLASKLAQWYAVEVFFNYVGQKVMETTNWWTALHHMGIYFTDLKPMSAILATSAMALGSQAPIDFADFALYSRKFWSLRAFNIATFAASVVSVSLATARTQNWALADWSFGVYSVTAVLFASAVFFRIPELAKSALLHTALPEADKPNVALRCQGVLRSLKLVR